MYFIERKEKGEKDKEKEKEKEEEEEFCASSVVDFSDFLNRQVFFSFLFLFLFLFSSVSQNHNQKKTNRKQQLVIYTELSRLISHKEK